MIKRHGIIGAVERAVNRKDETTGYATLIEMKMGDFAFEAVVLRHQQLFSPETVERARRRMGGVSTEPIRDADAHHS